jgi:hypothetical protein
VRDGKECSGKVRVILSGNSNKEGGFFMSNEPLVWVKDNAGNRFLCPMDSLMDPNSVSEEEKANCVDDASKLKDPKSVPGEGKIKFGESKSQS